jgi:hypothetical protein
MVSIRCREMGKNDADAVFIRPHNSHTQTRNDKLDEWWYTEQSKTPFEENVEGRLMKFAMYNFGMNGRRSLTSRKGGSDGPVLSLQKKERGRHCRVGAEDDEKKVGSFVVLLQY